MALIAGLRIESLSSSSTEYVLQIHSSLLLSLCLVHTRFHPSHAQPIGNYLSASTSISMLLYYVRHTRILHLLDNKRLVKVTAY